MNKIPKKIHYCWFGRNEKPEIIEQCINTWKKILLDYEIIEWNEDNFNIECNEFVRQAYESKKYAFVSDYARLYALYNYGGIYLDTDVEVLKSLDIFLEETSFWGYEEKNRIATSTFGCQKGNKLILEFMQYYEKSKFILDDGSYNMITNVDILTNLLKEKGFSLNGKFERINNQITIYPQSYFSPYDYINCIDKRNENSYAIHHFYKSWLPKNKMIKASLKKLIVKIIGGDKLAKIRNVMMKG